jgi:hypothetical protein
MMGRNATENENEAKNQSTKNNHLRCLDFALLFLQSTPNI